MSLNNWFFGVLTFIMILIIILIMATNEPSLIVIPIVIVLTIIMISMLRKITDEGSPHRRERRRDYEEDVK